MKYKLLALLLILTLSSSVSAQNIKLYWNQEKSSSHEQKEVLGFTKTHLVELSTLQGLHYINTYKKNNHQDNLTFLIEKQKDHKLKYQFIKAILKGDQIAHIYSLYAPNSREIQFAVDYLDIKGRLLIPTQKLHTITNVTKGQHNQMLTTISPNKDFLHINFYQPTERKKEEISYQILLDCSSKIKYLYGKKVKYTLTTEKIHKIHYYSTQFLSDKAELYSIYHFKDVDGSNTQKVFLHDMIVFKQNNKGDIEKKQSFKIDAKILGNAQLHIKDNSINIYGLYQIPKPSSKASQTAKQYLLGYSGFYHIKTNQNLAELKKETYTFDNDLIRKFYSNSKAIEKRIQKGELISIKHLIVKDIVAHKDGDLSVIAEQHTTFKDAHIIKTKIDAIIYSRFNNDGKQLYISNIKKKQYSSTSIANRELNHLIIPAPHIWLANALFRRTISKIDKKIKYWSYHCSSIDNKLMIMYNAHYTDIEKPEKESTALTAQTSARPVILIIDKNGESSKKALNFVPKKRWPIAIQSFYSVNEKEFMIWARLNDSIRYVRMIIE